MRRCAGWPFLFPCADERFVVATGRRYASDAHGLRASERSYPARPRVSGVRSSDIVFPDPLAQCNVDARLPSATVGLEVLDHVP